MEKGLKILALRQDSPFFKDCVDALRSLGHIVKIVDPAEEDNVSWELSSFRPNFIFSLDHTGFRSKILKGSRIPWASWFIDKPFYWITDEDISLKNRLIFVYDRVYVDRLRQFGFEDVFYLPLATNPNVFRRIDLNPEDIKRYGCNISFVGNSIDYHSRYHQLFKDPEDRAIADEAIRIQIENPMLNISDILEEIERLHHRSLNIRKSLHKDIIEMCLEGVASSKYRLKMIEEISDLGLNLYGDNGWKGLISKNIRFLGTIEYHSELPRLYNASKIHLNLTRIQLKTAINQRMFDGSACGCLVLNDYRRDLVNLFDLGEVVFFRDKDEMRELIQYYLVNSKERNEIAEKARQRVLNEHTFQHRMRSIVEIMVERFNI